MQCMQPSQQCACMLCNACTQAYICNAHECYAMRAHRHIVHSNVMSSNAHTSVSALQSSVSALHSTKKLGTLLPNAFQVELQTSVPAFHSTKYASQMHVVSGTKPSYNYRPGTLPVLPQCHLWGRAMCLRRVLQPTGSSR